MDMHWSTGANISTSVCHGCSHFGLILDQPFLMGVRAVYKYIIKELNSDIFHYQLTKVKRKRVKV